jgi:hypothetical protein
MDVTGAVDELLRMSLIQRTTAGDGTDFLDVPLVAAVFGLKKLGVSPFRASVEADVHMLREIGPTTETSLTQGIRPRIERLFGFVADQISSGKTNLDDMQPILELISRNYPPGWLLLADLYDESEEADSQSKAAESLRRYLETDPDVENAKKAWEKLAFMYERANDYASAADAYVRACNFPKTALSVISNLAHWLNTHRVQLNLGDPIYKDRPFRNVIALMESRIREATSNDLSRLAWLHLHMGDAGRAKELAEMGRAKDSSNVHCDRLLRRLEEQRLSAY